MQQPIEVVVTKFGGPEVLVTRPSLLTPDTVKLHSDEVLVRNSYAGVNFIDTYYRSGLYKKPMMPFVPGEEGAGEIVMLGSKAPSGLMGKHVAYFYGGGGGSYSSYTVVKTAAARVIPEGITDAQAASLVCQGFTAHYLVHDSYVCGPESLVVVHAAAGGTGLLICQMAKLRGATVIGICGGSVKAEVAKRVGRCDHVVDYTAESDWVAAVRAVCPESRHGRVDCVYDGVGKATFVKSVSLLRPHGYMISFGNASGAVPPLAPLELMRAGSIYLQRPTLADYLLTPSEYDKRAVDVFGWMAAGKLTLVSETVMPLTEAAQAHALLEGRNTIGKVLLKCL